MSTSGFSNGSRKFKRIATVRRPRAIPMRKRPRTGYKKVTSGASSKAYKAGTATMLTDSSRNVLVYKPIGNCPLPLEYRTQVRARGNGYLTQAGGVPVGWNNSYSWYLTSMTINNLYQPFAPLGVAGINQIDGLNWATSAYLQPIGHGTLCNATTYRKYQVTGARIKFRFLNNGVIDRIDAAMQALEIGGLAAGSYSGVVCNPLSKRTVFSSYDDNAWLDMYVDIAKYSGIDPQVFRADPDSQWSGAYNAAPSKQIGLEIAAIQACHQTMSQVGFEIEIQWYVRYYQLEVPGLL